MTAPPTPLEMWRSFADAFVAAVERRPDLEIGSAWTTCADRTRWYTDTVMPQVADTLRLQLGTEFLAVDYVLSTMSPSGVLVPMVFIESENDARSAAYEIGKLCNVAAPLKVLVTCVEWGDEPGYWPGGGMKARLLDEWVPVIEAHDEVWPQPHVLGICVAEVNGDRFRLYTPGLGAGGAVVDPERIAADRTLSTT